MSILPSTWESLAEHQPKHLTFTSVFFAVATQITDFQGQNGSNHTEMNHRKNHSEELSHVLVNPPKSPSSAEIIQRFPGVLAGAWNHEASFFTPQCWVRPQVPAPLPVRPSVQRTTWGVHRRFQRDLVGQSGLQSFLLCGFWGCFNMCFHGGSMVLFFKGKLIRDN